jgi:hypothetical protein
MSVPAEVISHRKPVHIGNEKLTLLKKKSSLAVLLLKYATEKICRDNFSERMPRQQCGVKGHSILNYCFPWRKGP